MAEFFTERFGLARWTADADTPSRTEFDQSFAQLEALGAKWLPPDLRANRPAPAPAVARTLFWAHDTGQIFACVDTDAAGTLSWVQIYPPDPSFTRATIDERVTKAFVDALDVDAATLGGTSPAGYEDSGTAAATMDTHEGATNPHGQYATDTDLSSHTGNTANPHGVTAAQANADPAGTAAAAVTDHEAEVDPHGQYATDTRLNNHIDSADPHPNAALVPSGGIIMWSGAADQVPAGWLLCDGLNGTPNLVDRFIVGAGGQYAVGTTGGASTVALGIAEMPTHNHTGPSHDHGNGTLTAAGAGGHDHGSGTLATTNNGGHNHTIDRSGEQSNENHTHISTSSSVPRRTGPLGGGSHFTNNAPNHNHGVTGRTSAVSNHTHNVTGTTSAAGTGNTGNAGSGNAHENRPPYYALAFIMRA